jgi:hypothetical protein
MSIGRVCISPQLPCCDIAPDRGASSSGIAANSVTADRFLMIKIASGIAVLETRAFQVP